MYLLMVAYIAAYSFSDGVSLESFIDRISFYAHSFSEAYESGFQSAKTDV